MSSHSLDLEDHDESVRIAVKALGDMRNGGARSDGPKFLSSPSYDSKLPLAPSPTVEPSSQPFAPPPTAENSITTNPPGLVSRMSHLPLVESALWAYEQGKASSRVVKYGAEMVESSVKTISRPVIDRLPVNQLDQFACRQLDKLDKYRSPSSAERSLSPIPIDAVVDLAVVNLKSREFDVRAPNFSRDSDRSLGKNVPGWLEATSPFVQPPPPPPESRSVTPTQSNLSTSQSDQTEVAQRSRWQAVLLEAGGLSAALSEDSMRRLKYCLQWLQYATAHIDAQILILRDFIASLQPLPCKALSANRRPPISEEHVRRLTDVRRDIVHTIRQVVDVVSKYAGGALPEPAKNRVRGFILGLPHRWASKAGSSTAGFTAATATTERERGVMSAGGTVAAAASGTGATARRGQQRRAAQRERRAGADSGFKSSPSSRATSPSASSSPRNSRPFLSGNIVEGDREKVGVSEGSAVAAAQRILTLATESLDMMRNVTGVVKDSLDRADAWVGRLRHVGLQRVVQDGDDAEGIPLEASSTSTLSEFDFPQPHHRHRTISTQSSALSVSDDAELPTSPVLSESSSTVWSIPSTPGRSCSSGPFASPHIHPASESGPVPRHALCENETLPVGIRLMSLSSTNSGNDESSEGITLSNGKDGVVVFGLDVDEEERKMDVDI